MKTNKGRHIYRFQCWGGSAETEQKRNMEQVGNRMTEMPLPQSHLDVDRFVQQNWKTNIKWVMRLAIPVRCMAARQLPQIESLD